MESFRTVRFTDASLSATSPGGLHSTLDRAGRSYQVLTNIVDSNTVNGAPTVKTITIQVAQPDTFTGAVTLRAVRVSEQIGPNR
jgi:hypothetical protein